MLAPCPYGITQICPAKMATGAQLSNVYESPTANSNYFTQNGSSLMGVVIKKQGY
jgi:hypothetical protein